MREIKFRGKRIIEPIKIERYAPDGWMYGDLLDCLDEMYILPNDISGEMYIDKSYRFRANDFEIRAMVAQVDPESVGQFTGLYDKNGKEIYEGDIVATKLDDKIITVGDIQYHCGVFGAEWRHAKKDKTMVGSWGQRHNLRRLDDDIIEKIEVIGNIYDNPELIKE